MGGLNKEGGGGASYTQVKHIKVRRRRNLNSSSLNMKLNVSIR